MTWEANLAALRARDADLAARVEAARGAAARGAGPPVEIVPARSGAPTARRGSTWLHSRYDPADEAVRAVDAIDLRGVQAAVVLGVGLGYGLEALAARLPGRPVVACESDAAVVAAALGARDLRAVLGDPRISWIAGGDAGEVRRRLEIALAAPECAFVRPVPHKPSLGADPAFHRAVLAEVERIAGLHRVSLAALESFGGLWVANAVRNLPRLGRADPVRLLDGAWRGRPAAVVAAGPSLEAALPHLARRRGGLVVAVDTALGACLEAGAAPDFVVAADAQEANLRDFDGLDLRGLSLVATHVVDPRTFDLPWSRIFGATIDDALGRWISDAAGGLGALRTGGSVATLAYDLARRAGASPIILVGLDLSWEGRTHARDAVRESAEAAGLGRFATLETRRRGRAGGERRRAVTRDGRAVETTEVFAAYAAWFEAEVGRPFDGPAPDVVVIGPSIMRAGRPGAPAEIPALLGADSFAPPARTPRSPGRPALEEVRGVAAAGLAAFDAAADLVREAAGRLTLEDRAAEAAAEAFRRLAAEPPLDPVVRAPVAALLDRLDGRTRPDAEVVRAGVRTAARLRTVIAAIDDVPGDADVLRANVERIAGRQPNLAGALARAVAAAAERYAVEPARSGAPTIHDRAGGRRLASGYDPRAEGARAAEAVPDGADEPVLVLSWGASWHVEAVLARSRGPVVVAEADPALLVAAFGARDLPCLADPRLSIVAPVDPTRVAAALRHVFDAERHRRIHVVAAPAVRGDAAYAGLERIAEEAVADRLRDHLTVLAQRPLWCANVVRNLPRLAGAASTAGLDRAFATAGVPAFVVGAGPSLGRNGRDLAAVGDGGLVAAADTAVRTLFGLGVRPHLVAAADANPANDADLAGVDPAYLDRVLLVVDPIVSPGLLARHTGPVAVARTANYDLDADGRPIPAPDPVTDLVEDLLGPVGRWQSGGSVATNALDLVLRMRCDPVVLAGMDLAFTGGATHAAGAAPAEVEAGRFATRETLHRSALRRRRLRRVAAWGGGDVETDAVLDSYRRWIEETYEHSFRGRVAFLDATEGGAAKRGIPPVPLAEAVRRHVRPGAGVAGRLEAALGPRLPARAEVARRLRLRLETWRAAAADRAAPAADRALAVRLLPLAAEVLRGME